jgi:transposase InsO family protein
LRLSSTLLKPGLRKTHEILLLDEYEYLGPVTLPDVKKVFEKHDLWNRKKKPKKIVRPRCRYEADYVNMIWHTDLHHFHGKHLIITWIDDKSRLCLGFKFLITKESKNTKQALLQVLEKYPQPFAIWIDNGTEFAGEFHQCLENRKIRHTHNQAYNPQQNGKCERYWRTLEKAPDFEQVNSIIENYNKTAHFGLPTIQRSRGCRHMTPQEVWEDEKQHFHSNMIPTWTIDGVSGIKFK